MGDPPSSPYHHQPAMVHGIPVEPDGTTTTTRLVPPPPPSSLHLQRQPPSQYTPPPPPPTTNTTSNAKIITNTSTNTGTTNPPPPPPTNGDGKQFQMLPPGWTTVISTVDGRIYYWEKETGRTSWVHPAAMPSPFTNDELPPPPPQSSGARGNNTNTNSNPLSDFIPPGIMSSLGMSNNNNNNPNRNNYYDNNNNNAYYNHNNYDTPSNAFRRPENHQCYAVASFILFFPVGICAILHSIKVDNAWNNGRFGDAMNHSRQVKNYSCLGCTLGIIFWLYYICFREESNFEWPKFDWNWD